MHPLRRTTLKFLLAAAPLALVACGLNHNESPPPPPSPPPATHPPPATATTLPIAPSMQETPVWCWAASAEMVFQYYGLPNLNPAGDYQCGIVAAAFSSSYPACLSDCTVCSFPVGPMTNEQQIINGYGPFLRSYGISSRVLSSTLVFRALTTGEIADEISAGRPVVIGIAPSGGVALPNASQHIAVLVGYDYSGGQQSAIVNDPFPFHLYPYSQYPNPYLAAGGMAVGAGRYHVPYHALVISLGWANTIYRIR